MSIYLGSEELDPKTIGGDDIEAIYVGTDQVWSAGPSTKRLLLYVTTDGEKSNDGEWIDDIGNRISYVDMPKDYNGIFLIGNDGDRYDFVTLDSNWEHATFSERFVADPIGIQGVVFKGIKYIPSVGTAFTVDLTTKYQPIPTAYTQGILQDGDKMIMVFETQSVPTFTAVDNRNYGNMNSAIASAVKNGEGLSTFNVSCGANKILLGSDGYYYYATLGVVSWYPEDSRNCYVRMSIKGEDYDPTYIVEKYYIETGTLGNSSFCNYFQQGDSTYIPAIASYVGDQSIVDVQTLGEYIYNKLQ